MAILPASRLVPVAAIASYVMDPTPYAWGPLLAPFTPSNTARSGGTIFSIILDGGREQAWALLDALELIDISNNIGDARSLMCHNASTTHYSVSEEVRAEMGVSEGMLRLNVGLEDPEDLIEDLDQALKAAGL